MKNKRNDHFQNHIVAHLTETMKTKTTMTINLFVVSIILPITTFQVREPKSTGSELTETSKYSSQFLPPYLHLQPRYASMFIPLIKIPRTVTAQMLQSGPKNSWKQDVKRMMNTVKKRTS